MLREKIDHRGIDRRAARASGADRVKARRPDGSQDRLRHEAQGAVVVADEENVQGWMESEPVP